MSAPFTLAPSGVARFAGLPPGFAAGFTTRRGALDTAPRDDAARALAEALGTPLAEAAFVKQVHGRGVAGAEGPAALGESRSYGEADALVTGAADRLLVVATADCAPIVLLDPTSGLLAAIHAGWRGAAARVVDAALDALLARGASATTLVALFGPSIRRDAYEVGPEVVAALAAACGDVPVAADAVAPGRGDRSFVDVAAWSRAALLARGVAPENVLDAGLCTFREAALLPSFRRDGPRAGRLLMGVVRASEA